jgi:ribonuclease HI
VIVKLTGTFDASYSEEEKQAGLGSVIKRGKKIVAKRKRKTKAESPEHGEWLALSQLIELAVELRIKELRAAGDCAAVIREMRRRKKALKELQPHIHTVKSQITKLKQNLNKLTFHWLPRSHNRSADRLAREALKEGK